MAQGPRCPLKVMHGILDGRQAAGEAFGVGYHFIDGSLSQR